MAESEQELLKLTPAEQMVAFWRILHLTVGQFGNYPMGQLLVALTITFLQNRDMHPTLTDLCKATGLPKATVSRYVSSQVSQGMVREVIDPNDRRRRFLLRTVEGGRAWEWLVEQVKNLFEEVTDLDTTLRLDGSPIDPKEMLAGMKILTNKNRSLPKMSEGMISSDSTILPFTTLTPDQIMVEARMAIFWHILHLLIARYGNHPMGQLLVALTAVFLSERGMPPTLTDLCDATGLPKASVSRYVSWQVKSGMASEAIDPTDRRRHFLLQTAKGKCEWRWQMEHIQKLFDVIADEAKEISQGFPVDTAADVMEKMMNATRNAPPLFR